MASWPRGWSTAHLLNLHRSGARGWNWSWLGWEIRSGISATFSGEAMRTDTASAEDRVRLFRLAWDTCCSAFGSRQILYERFSRETFTATSCCSMASTTRNRPRPSCASSCRGSSRPTGKGTVETRRREGRKQGASLPSSFVSGQQSASAVAVPSSGGGRRGYGRGRGRPG